MKYEIMDILNVFKNFELNILLNKVERSTETRL